MKTIFITEEGHKQRLDSLYLAFHKAVGSCDFRDLGKEQLQNLRWYFDAFVNKDRFDRIIFHVDFDILDSQLKFLQTLPNLVLLDFQANKESVVSEAYFKRYKKFLRQIPWARIIVSSFTFAELLRDEGFDAWALPKGVDDARFVDFGFQRELKTGFIGSADSVSREIRRELLQKLPEVLDDHYYGEDLPLSEYIRKLNQIKYFVNPDQSLNEYTYRYFEAMACGAIIIGVDQGKTENDALGFEDMKNIVLANTPSEFKQKVLLLERSPRLTRTIQENAKQLVLSKFTFDKIGLTLFKLIDMKLRNPKDHEPALNIFGFRF